MKNLINLANKNLLSLIIFIYLISSINSPIFIPSNFEYKTIINFLRSISPIILIFLFIFLIFKNKIKFNLTTKLFIILILSQLLGFINYDYKNYFDLYWVVAAISLILFLEIYCNNQRTAQFILIVFVSIIFFIGLIINFFIFFEEVEKIFNISINLTSGYLYNSNSVLNSFFNQPVPRNSGYARYLLVVNLFIFALFYAGFFKKINFNFNFWLKNLLIVYIIFNFYIIWQIQNRGTLYFTILVGAFFIIKNIINFNKKNLIFLFFIFILPFLIFKGSNILVYKFTKSQFEKNYKMKSQVEISNDEINKMFLEENKHIINSSKRWLKPNETSGRVQIWQKSIKQGKENIFFGLGPQTDRNLLNNNASNIYIYYFLNSGLVGLFILLIFILNLFFQFLKLLKKKIYHDTVTLFCVLTIFFLMFRGLVENTFGVFSIDMVLFLLSIKYLESVQTLSK